MKHLYEKANIIKNGHYKLTSGRHSNFYVNKDAIYSSDLFEQTINEIAENCNEFNFDIVTGPAVAGAVLAAPVWLTLVNKYNRENIRFVYPEKYEISHPESIDNRGEIQMAYTEKGMIFRRGYDKVLQGKSVIIIEDIITTGSSVMKTVEAIEKCGGTVNACCCIWNRSNWKPKGKNFFVISLINEIVQSWDPSECPYCKHGALLVDPKTGKILD